MFQPGDMVAYPMHGAGVIEAIEEKEILGAVASYYVLRVGGIKAMVPVEGEASGLRPIIDTQESEKVLAFLTGDSDEQCQNWNRRYRENLEKMRTGDIYQVADVVRCLMQREREKGLSTGERKMLLKAQHILSSELMLSLSLTQEQVMEMIEQNVQ
ncbi:CarD family transcriptional regulator [Eubacteriales bacterium OttesenSCG-928-N14]|nr:CarD family transcriptional regulator [Eubacteriales bacterium OttesenSCG-928-N14]